MSLTRVGSIGNQYGGLVVKSEDGKFFWCVQCPDEGDEWEEITESLYNEIIKFENTM